MTYIADEDIVERTLIRILFPTPTAEPMISDIPRKKFRHYHQCGANEEPENEVLQSKYSQPTKIAILEILSNLTVSVRWSDARYGHYAEQTWRLGLARSNSTCALTGMQIERGEEVFRPQCAATSKPANWNKMILASAITPKS